ncbi:MAG: hypothetical protein KDD61_12065 [Bdellovibrionales bacterium]|nr:hypothetical protein [Bdellovibrionales bacterium]
MKMYTVLSFLLAATNVLLLIVSRVGTSSQVLISILLGQVTSLFLVFVAVSDSGKAKRIKMTYLTDDDSETMEVDTLNFESDSDLNSQQTIDPQRHPISLEETSVALPVNSDFEGFIHSLKKVSKKENESSLLRINSSGGILGSASSAKVQFHSDEPSNDGFGIQKELYKFLSRNI